MLIDKPESESQSKVRVPYPESNPKKGQGISDSVDSKMDPQNNTYSKDLESFSRIANCFALLSVPDLKADLSEENLLTLTSSHTPLVATAPMTQDLKPLLVIALMPMTQDSKVMTIIQSLQIVSFICSHQKANLDCIDKASTGQQEHSALSGKLRMWRRL